MKITAVLDTRSKRVSNQYPIYIRLTIGSTRTLIPTGNKVDPKYWNNGQVRRTHPDASIINARITDMISDIHRTEAECLLKGIPFNIDLLGKEQKSYDFVESVLSFANQYLNEGNFTMHKRFMVVYNDIHDYYKSMPMDTINEDLIKDFILKLKARGNNPNTIHKKVKMLGAVLGSEIKRGRFLGNNWFSTYKIKTQEAKRGFLTSANIQKLEQAQLSDQLTLYRDMFMFSYYSQGQRFGDVLLCRKDQITGDRINFIQLKTSTQVSVYIHDKLKTLIEKYKSDSEYIFPIIKKVPKDKLETYRTIGVYNTVANRNLKIIAELLEIPKFSFHYARYSFASGLMEHTDSIHIIKQALGHKKYATTEIYLKMLLNKKIDAEVIKLFSNK